jgi:hypothetical protein
MPSSGIIARKKYRGSGHIDAGLVSVIIKLPEFVRHRLRFDRSIAVIEFGNFFCAAMPVDGRKTQFCVV